MLRIAELIGHELKWTQPHATKMEYALCAGDVEAATLRFRSSFGTFATGTSADGAWTFKRVGFTQTKVTVRACEAHVDLAAFKNNTWSGGGTLELPDGRKYPASTNSWATQYSFKTEAGDLLICYKKIHGMLHMSSETEIYPIARDMPELPWMVMLGWYLTIMMYVDSSVMTAAVVTTTS